MPRQLKQLQAAPDLVEQYRNAFNKEPRLKEARGTDLFNEGHWRISRQMCLYGGGFFLHHCPLRAVVQSQKGGYIERCSFESGGRMGLDMYMHDFFVTAAKIEF